MVVSVGPGMIAGNAVLSQIKNSVNQENVAKSLFLCK
jgi:hypothetical protein